MLDMLILVFFFFLFFSFFYSTVGTVPAFFYPCSLAIDKGVEGNLPTCEIDMLGFQTNEKSYLIIINRDGQSPHRPRLMWLIK